MARSISLHHHASLGGRFSGEELFPDLEKVTVSATGVSGIILGRPVRTYHQLNNTPPPDAERIRNLLSALKLSSAAVTEARVFIWWNVSGFLHYLAGHLPLLERPGLHVAGRDDNQHAITEEGKVDWGYLENVWPEAPSDSSEIGSCLGSLKDVRICFALRI